MSSHLPEITTTSPTDWSYLSEGGATIVFAYAGPPNDSFAGTVLRLRKIANAGSKERAVAITHEPEGQPDPDTPCLAFHRQIISKLISPAYLPSLVAVELEEEWLRKLAVSTATDRPDARRAVDGIHIRCRRGVLATNLVGRTGWAVEIKPKWGFLPSPYHLSEATRSTKLAYCRYCMHTHRRWIAAVMTRFCPLDLFSGNAVRVRQAITALWNAWIATDGSLNNLRLFTLGQCISPNQERGLTTLLKEMNVDVHDPHLSVNDLLTSAYPIFVDNILRALLETPLLHTIQTLQQTLDPLDIEGLAKLWEAAAGSPFGAGLAEITNQEWASFLEEYVHEMRREPPDLASEWADPPAQKLRYCVVAYVLSATFKDCSVMLHFAPGQIPTVAVIDLDPKPIGRLAKWEQQDASIVREFIAVKGNTRPCCRSIEMQ